MSYALTLTNHGTAAIAAALVSGTRVVFATVALSDFSAETLTPESTAMLGVKWSAEPIAVAVTDAGNVKIRAVVPPEVGGWYARSLGVFDIHGQLLAFAAFPECYKPAAAVETTSAQWNLDLLLTIGSDNKPAIFAPTAPEWLLDAIADLVGDLPVPDNIQRGSVPVPSGASSVVVTFAAAFPAGAVPIVVATAKRPTSGDNLAVTVENVTNSGFTAVLTSYPDTVGYTVNYVAILP